MNLLTKLTQKKCSQFKTEKKKNHNRVLHIRISLGAKFQLQQTILIFWTKFTQKNDTFDSKTEQN